MTDVLFLEKQETSSRCYLDRLVKSSHTRKMESFTLGEWTLKEMKAFSYVAQRPVLTSKSHKRNQVVATKLWV